MKIIKFILR